MRLALVVLSLPFALGGCLSFSSSHPPPPANNTTITGNAELIGEVVTEVRLRMPWIRSENPARGMSGCGAEARSCTCAPTMAAVRARGFSSGAPMVKSNRCPAPGRCRDR
jgi:hypothetical protein